MLSVLCWVGSLPLSLALYPCGREQLPTPLWGRIEDGVKRLPQFTVWRNFLEEHPRQDSRPLGQVKDPVQKYILRRLLLFLPVLLGLTILVFLATRVLPGDATISTSALEGGGLTEADTRSLLASWGLDRPVYVQYGMWLQDLFQGDLGTSWTTGRSVKSLLWSRVPATLNLVVFAMILAVIIGIPLGMISAYNRNTPLDYSTRILAILGLAIPNFWFGVMIIIALVLAFNWTPPLEYIDFLDDPIGNLEKMSLPAFVLGYTLAALIARMTRTAILEVLREDYVRTSYAKGLKGSTIATRHVFRNAALPVITVVGVYLASTVGGVVVVEKVFNIQGLGSLLVQAVQERDFPILQGELLLVGLLVSVVNLAIDLSYAFIDPRIRYE